MVAVLGVETGPVNEVDPASNDVTGSESWPVCLASPGAAEAVAVVTVVTVRVLVPTRKPWGCRKGKITSLFCISFSAFTCSCLLPVLIVPRPCIRLFPLRQS